ncbi:MAG: ABC transporter permease [candidate division WOR-3 bacterium]|jgi:ABC-2 type transport system permease protein|nr:ABC transporter permease [candidate division WOR-3 bacterium]MCR4424016.1 ABC transporter permease [candidate division WOR-3 bacterium]MDH7519565.1 ABC transporter permease [bacterium]
MRALGVELRALSAEFGKTVRIWLSYPIMIFFWAIFPLIWVMPYVFQGRALVGGATSESFRQLTGSGNYLAFVLIGAMISTFVFSALWGVGNSLREETYWGTMEYIIASPTHPLVILIGKTLAEWAWSTVMAVFQATIISIFFGVRFTIDKVLPIILLVGLLMIGFYGFAIAFAGFTLLIKEVHGWVHTLEWIFFLFSPIRYPVQVNPITAMVSTLIPLTWALIAIRGIILLNKSEVNLWQTVLILLVMDAILLTAGYFLFVYLEKKTRRDGTVGMH